MNVCDTSDEHIAGGLMCCAYLLKRLRIQYGSWDMHNTSD